MSDETEVQAEPNVDEVQPINPVEQPQDVSRETIRERPENVPEKFCELLALFAPIRRLPRVASSEITPLTSA
mgnify:CR=1 FL=1